MLLRSLLLLGASTRTAPSPASTEPDAQMLPRKRPAAGAHPLKRLATPHAPARVHSNSVTITVTSTDRTTGPVQNSNQNSPGPRSAHTARNTAPTAARRCSTTRAISPAAGRFSAISTASSTSVIIDSSTGKCQDKNAEKVRHETNHHTAVVPVSHQLRHLRTRTRNTDRKSTRLN